MKARKRVMAGVGRGELLDSGRCMKISYIHGSDVYYVYVPFRRENVADDSSTYVSNGDHYYRQQSGVPFLVSPEDLGLRSVLVTTEERVITVRGDTNINMYRQA